MLGRNRLAVVLVGEQRGFVGQGMRQNGPSRALMAGIVIYLVRPIRVPLATFRDVLRGKERKMKQVVWGLLAWGLVILGASEVSAGPVAELILQSQAGDFIGQGQT